MSGDDSAKVSEKVVPVDPSVVSEIELLNTRLKIADEKAIFYEQLLSAERKNTKALIEVLYRQTHNP